MTGTFFYLWTGGEAKGGRRKETEKCGFPFSVSILTVLLALCCAVFCCRASLKKKKKVIPCWHCAYRLKLFLIFTYASKLSIFSPWQLLCSPSLRPHTLQSPLPLKWFLISEVLQREAAWDGILTVYRCISGGFTRDIKKRMVKTEGTQAEVFWFSVPLGPATKTLGATWILDAVIQKQRSRGSHLSS